MTMWMLCRHCHGVLPVGAAKCPHCGQKTEMPPCTASDRTEVPRGFHGASDGIRYSNHVNDANPPEDKHE
ncbi:MAG: hypothetical protein J5654_11265 [Victivallales bacterium]|nr:hypothetical protein [Victivallales bacterium]